MLKQWRQSSWTTDLWWHGKTTRRQLLGLSAVSAAALGATVLVPAPWRRAFGKAAPYKLGSLQPLSGPGAAGGITALVGTQMAVDRINQAGGLHGRPIELYVEDTESSPAVGRRKAVKLATDDAVDVHEGGFLSNICLACTGVWEQYQIVNMIGVCLDTALTGTRCNRYTFRPFDYAPAQAVAFAPYLVEKMGRKWYLVYADCAWGQSTHDAYAKEIRNAGGEIVGTLGIPLGTPDMTQFLPRISGDLDGVFAIFFGSDAVRLIIQADGLGLMRKYRWAGDGAVAESTNLPALGRKIEGFIGINRYVPVLEPPLDTPWHRRWLAEAKAAMKKVDPTGPLPDRYVQSNFEAINFLKLGIEQSGFQGRSDTPKLIAALEGMEVEEGDDFPQGDKTLTERAASKVTLGRPGSAVAGYEC